ncbi:MFS-type transporter SLC18B1-like [Lethenteron reissneri]|uniref:MFS-type transporter SLC18B1-like n=1 Tax=Lethenteron reissneri TaxID=7753 RepID=UPI002AB688D2|nr:MFS-type transporter SLC18B1-like [Lethenteron reissneri]XP_061410340.1 MFS-type transporter SLC18B1-like [Lethenteron reissneri]
MEEGLGGEPESDSNASRDLASNGEDRGATSGTRDPARLEEEEEEESNPLDVVGSPSGGVEPDGQGSGFTRKEYLTMLSVASINFSSMICYAVLAPFFPKEAAKKGASDSIVGLIFGSFALMNLLSSPLFGKYIVHIGSKFMFLSGMLVSGTCTILFGLLDEAPSGSVYIAMCFVVRCMDALGCAASTTASFTILAGTFPNNIATVMGFLEIFTGLGLVLGPPVGGFLYELWGFKLPFLVIGTFVLLMIPINLAILPPQDSVPSNGSFVRLVMLPPIVVVSLLICSLGSSLGFFDPTFSLFLSEQFDLKPGKIGLVFAGLCITYALSSPFIGYISDKKPHLRRRIMAIGAFVSGICFCMLGPVPFLHIPTQLWLLVVVLFVLGVSIGTAIVPTFSEILSMAYENGFEEGLGTLGLVSGLFSSLMSFGSFVGPTLGGFLNERIKFKWASAVQGLFLLVAACIMSTYYICVARCKKRHREAQERNEPSADETRPLLSETPR